MEAFLNEYCFNWISIGHNREPDGFVETWYDEIDAGSEPFFYYFTAPSQDQAIYFTVETYSYNIVPEKCTTGSSTVRGFEDEYKGYSPLLYFGLE